VTIHPRGVESAFDPELQWLEARWLVFPQPAGLDPRAGKFRASTSNRAAGHDRVAFVIDPIGSRGLPRTPISDASVVPIKEIVEPNRQRLDVSIGGGDNVANQERSSGWHRKSLVV
jgi:hypothetical protein